MRKIRVLIVDDSPVVRSILSRIISAETDMEVIGQAADPFEAKRWIMEESPDVVTLDVEMPRMDGITFLKRIMAYKPLPVIMISSYTQENSMRTMEALEAGAIDFVPKPTSNVEESLNEIRREITAKIRAAGWARVRPSVTVRRVETAKKAVRMSRIMKIMAIGASTGGTQAIERLLSSMKYKTMGIVIVQHMPPRYTASFAQRLDSLLGFPVSEAKDRERLAKDKVLVAPGGRHMRLLRDSIGYYVRLDDGPLVNHQKPSVDVLFQSVAESAGREAVGIVLTGMGDDGARGLLAMRQAGSFTVAQDEDSSVVYGMPRVAAEMGGVCRVAGLSEIADVVFAHAKSW
ncbi:MAG: chemotaxis response regulator protein-glutamate methylesterase [Deltaproteobacteria bacterium]|nr:chemotaxis response regulator protein-glutamate methylesterase [Deltaproteobacteria bacterium]